MNKKNEEILNDLIGGISQEVKQQKSQKLKTNQESLDTRTKLLPPCYQHRIALMRNYLADFDIHFWEMILKCCELAVNIYDNCPDKDFSKISADKVAQLAKGMGYMSLDDKAFALELAITRWYDEKEKRDFDNQLVMHVRDPWPIDQIPSHKRECTLIVYRNSEAYARINNKFINH